MDEFDREMEVIALLSNPDDNYAYISCDSEEIKHSCDKTGETNQIKLIDVEYFMDASLKEDKANFCDKCNQVFVLKK